MALFSYTHGMSVDVLDREMFTEAEAARLLRLPQRTLNYWLEGGDYRGRVYRPVIRVEPKGGHAAVTWAEFVEAGLLREYRQTHRIPMAELRGRPAVKGISTEAIREHEQTGETVSDIADDFGLTDEDVLWALAYETSARAA
jgi:hypothetical protein